MKKTLITLVIASIVSSMLIGCSPGAEGNTTNDVTTPGAGTKSPTDGANTPAAGGTAGAPATPSTGA